MRTTETQMANISKKDLVRALSEKLGTKLVDTTPVVDAFMQVLTESLVANERVEVRGFGRFTVRSKPARTARNPQTGAAVHVPARKVIQFKAASDLKTAVSNGVTVEAASA